MKKLIQKSSAVGAAVFLTGSVAVQAATLYDNTTTDTGYSLNFTNGWTIGNEIIMGGGIPSAMVTNFSFEIYSTQATFTGANVQMQAFLYANDGTPFNGYATPSSILYDSGLFTLLTPQQYTILNALPLSDAVTLQFDLTGSPAMVMATNFTLGIVVTGLDSTDIVGVELFGPAGFGLNHGDYWANDGLGWVLLTNAVPTSFGAEFTGTVTPEPSVLYLGAVGATLLTGLTWLRRRQNTSQQN